MFSQHTISKTTQHLLSLTLGTLSLLSTQALAQETNIPPCTNAANISTCASDLTAETTAVGLGTAPNNDNILSALPSPPPLYSEPHLEVITEQINQTTIPQASATTCQPAAPNTARCQLGITYRF